jgi:hypothetical protein
MSMYSPQTWNNGIAGGTPINAARLTHIEDGLESLDVRVREEGLLDVRSRGAILDNTTDDSAAIQESLNDAAAAGASGGIIIPGLACTQTPLTIPADNMVIAGTAQGKSRIYNNVSNVFNITAAGRSGLLFERLSLLATAGHVFNVGGANIGVGQSVFRNMKMQQDNTAKSIWNQTAGVFLDNEITNCELTHSISPASVSAWKLVSAEGGINTNTFRRLRCYYSGDYFFHIENQQVGSYASCNSFRDINFEITNGGNIRILSGLNTIIENCGTYDLHLAGNTTNHLYFLGKNASAPVSSDTRFLSVQRHGGVLGGGLHDIWMEGGQSGGTTITTCNGSIALNLNNALIINCPTVTFTGLGSQLQMTLDRTGLYDGDTRVIGPRGAAVADAVAAAGAPTQAEFNALVTQVNALLARLRSTTGHGLFT